ncbi:MAG: aminopeptidase P family protein [bacterium]|nr:aminopeptidase P family protein [bacterium]
MIRERITRLQNLMKERGIDYYVIPSDDYHSSEYVHAFFKCRAYMSGFTGSAGTLIVSADSAGLWTDGRYFLQAEEQLSGSGITLYRSGEKDVPTMTEYLAEALLGGGTLGFDGRVITKSFVDKLFAALEERRRGASEAVTLRYEEDLVGLVWEDRPALTAEPAYELDVCFAGESRADKLARVRTELAKQEADCLILTSLDDIAWLLNIRGGDVAYNPVVRSYFLLEKDGGVLYMDQNACPPELTASLKNDNIVIKEYNAIYGDVRTFADGTVVQWDEQVVNYALIQNVNPACTVVAHENPTLLFKACKNPTEVENMRKAHVKDGVALCKFLCWLDKAVPEGNVTELSAADKLEEFRCEQEHYRGQSFEPIIGYGAHGAIIHYSATEESSVTLQPEGFVLMDTGGQYLEGTTDVTRTVALGKLTQEQKKHFTAVLKGNLNLASARFMEGTTGLNLDFLARKALWELGLDYRHGTGHGVGYFLNVHEGPNAFRLKAATGRETKTPFVEGMITSDEPGVYFDGRYGIRLENLIVCCKDQMTEYGQLMRHEYLTMAPFDLRAVELSMLTKEEKTALNAYHKKVYDTISPMLNEDEREWLAQATVPVA